MGINNWLELGQATLGKFFDAAGTSTALHTCPLCVRLPASLPRCLPVPVPVPLPVPVSGRIIRWLSAFALIYEESATSDHSISSSVGNTVGDRKGPGVS